MARADFPNSGCLPITDKKQSTGDLNIHESYKREKRPGDEVDPTKVLKELY